MTDQKRVLNWQEAWSRSHKCNGWIAETAFGTIQLVPYAGQWTCIKHPNPSYAYLDVPMRELMYAQVKAEIAYFRALDRAVKERTLTEHPVHEAITGLRSAPLEDQQMAADVMDAAVDEITAEEDEAWLQLARQQLDKEQHESTQSTGR